MNIFKNKPKLPPLPSLADVDAEYGETLANRLRLQAERLALIAEAGQLRADIASGSPAEQAARVASVMEGQPFVSASARLNEVLQRITVLDSAITGLYGRAQNELHRASRRLCDTVREKHDQIVKQIAIKMVEIHSISTEYFALLNAIEHQGASTGSFSQLNLRAISHPHDHYSMAGYFLRSVRDGGLITNDELPEVLR
jgi:hypothetical protein